VASCCVGCHHATPLHPCPSSHLISILILARVVPPADAINVNLLQFGGANGGSPVQYKYTTDHSKWGIAVGGGDEIVCDGGMNRMTSQMTRGGGAACFVQPDLWAGLKAMIVEADSC